jgi:hypothetical protein
MRTIPYNTKEKNTGSTETHVATDTKMDDETYDAQRMEEGFAASDGVRAGTAESGGRVKRPESSDSPFPDRTPLSIEKENPGLAD